MSTDRPDKTESPFTVPAGHLQVELDVLALARDEHDTVRTTSIGVAPLNVKLGLLDHIDLQFLVQPFVHEQVSEGAGGASDANRAVNELGARLKVNFWGDDGGRTAFGVIPFMIAAPSWDGTGRDVNWGVILPLAVALGEDWSLGVMLEGDLEHDAAGAGRHGVLIGSATVGHEIGRLGAYGELYAEWARDGDTRWVRTLDAGVTYALNSNLQLDAGVNVGVSGAADGLGTFVGVSWRR